VSGSLSRIGAIAWLASRETLRSRTMLIAIILNLLYLLIIALAAYSIWTSGLEDLASGLGDRQRQSLVRIILLIAIAGASTLALFTGVFSSVGAIGGEIERGTILALAARPVARWEILLGKFLGNAGLAAAYLVVQGLLIGLAVGALSGIFVPDLMAALALLALNVLVMVAVAVAGSTRLTTVANAVVVVVLFLGLTNTTLLYLLGQVVDSELLRAGADWARLALPVGIISDLASEILLGEQGAAALASGGGRSLLPVHDWIWLYGIGYLVVVLAVGAWSFARRDLR
jgi:Cu-processing system permease protein